MTDFVSLHNQTSFSLLDSLIEPKALFKRAKELGQTAIAITDHGSLAATWSAWKASQEVGIKLIIGCEFYFQDDVNVIDDKFRHVILLAKNATGYKNLLTLNRKGFDTNCSIGKRVYSVIDWEMLEKYSDGLICLTACGNGIISQLLMKHNLDAATTALIKLRDIFGDDLGIEVQPNNMKRGSNIYNDEIDQFFLNRQLINLGQKYAIRIVAACNSHYLNKDESETHDVLLAIGSHQPIYSNYRLRYTVPDFYLKSGDEVKAFFSRNYTADIAQQVCDNSVYFANKCEIPEWIDPKYSNPSGKELPIFPVQGEPDYPEFLAWKNLQPDDIKKMDEDKLLLRYRCEANFDSRVSGLTPAQKIVYNNRIEEELDVLEFHGFSSYMLIVADFLNWARKHEIAVGEGRGCLTGDAQVLTSNGFRRLDSIKIGDTVYSHTGQPRNVLNTFRFDVSNEQLLKIKTRHSFGDIVLTKNHKVYACKSKETEQYQRLLMQNKSFHSVKRYEQYGQPDWIEASNLQKNDAIYTTFPNRSNVVSSLPSHYLLKSSSTKNSKLDLTHTISVDADFMYFIGRFVGDGWIRYPNNNGYDAYAIGIAFNSEDGAGIQRLKEYFTKNGLNVSEYKHKSKKLIQLMVHNKSLVEVVKKFFPEYNNTSNTKHLPAFFREMPNEYLIHMLNGIIDSDGFRKEKTRCGYDSNRISIDSTSERLILEIKEMLLFLKTKSSISFREKFYRGKYLCNKSYKLRFNKQDILGKAAGYFSKISDISATNSEYVYDITVDTDHSYLTSNYVVHNSVGGSLVAYLLGIHQADPIKYNLIFARFHNKEKSSFPDIDSDIAPSGRELVQDYIRQKYGDDFVCHVSNVNTITPKVYARDIARACELGGSKEDAVRIGNDVADCIPADIHSIEDALVKVPLFSEYVKKYPEFEKYKSICGKYRAWSTHAGGIIVSARSLTGLVPLRKDKDGVLAIEYDKEKAEENGLVKIDTLGLSTLDIIGQTIKLIKMAGKEAPPEPLNYDEYDEETYNIISSGDTFGVFQLGTSGGTIDLCRRIKPKSINDISYINSLARPSARDMRNDFIATKDGKKKFSLLHPNLGRAFNNTFGFGLYEESLMYLAQDIAGWSLHSADRLRKLTKEKGKNPKKAKEWRAEFIRDSIKNGVQENIATRIWDEVIELFQGYGFNQSLSVLENVDIYTSEGQFLASKTIGDVMTGEYVRSRDEKTGQDIFVEVIDKHDHGVLKLFEVELDSGEKVRCTKDHKFRVKETGEMLPLWMILEKDYSIVVNKNE